MATPKNSAGFTFPLLFDRLYGGSKAQAGQNALDQILSAFTPEGAKAVSDKVRRQMLEKAGLTDEQVEATLAAEAARPTGTLPLTRAPASPDAAAPAALSAADLTENQPAAAPENPPVEAPVNEPPSGSSFLDGILGRPARSRVPFRPATEIPTAAAAAAVTPTAPAAARGSRTALAHGAPSGTEEAREFARGLFANSQIAQQQLDQYRKANPKADANDPRLKSLQDAAAVAGTDAQAGVSWATMTPSARQSVLTQEDRDAQRARTKLMTGSFQDEVNNQAWEQKSRKDLLKAQGMPEEQADYTAAQGNLIEAGKYYNETGVMRGGAGVGTSTTPGGGVISAPDAAGNRTLTSPYGKGSVTYLTPEQMKNRPEAIMDGKPASQFFDEAAMRQGKTFTVGDATYSPEMSPADRAQNDLDEQKRKAEEERKKFASQIIK